MRNPRANAASAPLAALQGTVQDWLRRRAALDAIGRGLLVAACGTVLAETAARIIHFPGLRAVELGILAGATAVAIHRWRRQRPAADAWLAEADAESPEPGVFSAAQVASNVWKLSPLVIDRAKAAASTLNLRRLPPPPTLAQLRRGLAAAALAIVIALLPGRARPAGALDDALAGRAHDEAARLAALAAGAKGVDPRALGDAARGLTSADLTRAQLADIRTRIDLARRGSAEQLQRLLDRLGSAPLLRAFADALRDGQVDPARRAASELAARLSDGKLDLDGRQDLAAALRSAAAIDPGSAVGAALSEAGDAAGRGDGAGTAEALARVATALRERRQAVRDVDDIVVTLKSLELAPGDSTAAAGTPHPTLPAGPAPASPGARNFQFDPGRLDTTDIVVQRYFALTPPTPPGPAGR